MDLQTILLVIAALVPAVYLCIYVYKKDRAEKEPVSLLLTLLFFGVLICFPAAEIEGFMSSVIKAIVVPMGHYDGNTLMLPTFAYYLHHFLTWFIGVGLVEEGLKWIVLLLLTRRNKNFNSLFDGIIYSVFVSLGFAGYENILYVTEYGFGNALVRAVCSVPGHMFFAVLMGIYYSMWKVNEKVDFFETQYQNKALLSKKDPGLDKVEPKKYLVLSLLMPTLAHGLYDFGCSVDDWWAPILFYGFLAFLYWYCFRKIGEMSRGDMDNEQYARILFKKLYPNALIDENDEVSLVDAQAVEKPAVPESPDKGLTARLGADSKVYRYPNGDKFIGMMQDGKPEGFGIYLFATGEKYEGMFRGGRFHGYRVYLDTKYNEYAGNWENHVRHGRGVLRTSDGKKIQGVWENGALVSVN